MTVLVCGGRDFNDATLLDTVLSQAHPGHVIHGGARGADRMAGAWATARGIAVTVYPADWKGHGKSAGPRRNQHMLDSEPGITQVIAFPGGRGTADMVERAKRKGIPVLEIVYRPLA
jgi:hypothetical protein